MTASVLPQLEFLGPSSEPPAYVSVPAAQEEGKARIEQPEPLKAKPMDPPEIDMTEAQRERLGRYLDSELYNCFNERQPQMAKFARLWAKYRTKYPEFPKDFPMVNSSQLTVPTIKTAVNTLAARIYQTVMAAEPLASFRARDPEFTDVANGIEKFISTYGSEKLNLDEQLEDVVTEIVILGTAVVEVSNRNEVRALAKYDRVTKKYSLEDTVIFNGPGTTHFPIEDFWCRPAYQDIQKAPWCAKSMRLTWSQIKDMAYNGILDPDRIDRIWRYRVGIDGAMGEVSEVQITQEEIDKARPNERDEYQLFEIGVRWDPANIGTEQELICYYHWPSRTVLRARYNTFLGGRRPWVIFRYTRLPHRLYGEGLAEALEHLQDEISTIHNQRIDNASIANLKIILVSRLIRGLSPGDRLWSGKIVKVTDQKDVGALSLGDPYRSTVQDEGISQNYVREVSGIGEVATGQAQPVSRTTATAQLSLLEELNRRFDKALKGIRRSIREMHVQLLDLFIQNGTGGAATEYLGSEEGPAVEEFLALPGDMVHRVLKVQTFATKATVNREVEFQSSIAVMNLIVQIGQQMLAMVGQLAPQATGVVAHELVSAIRPVFKKVMQYADAPSADSALSVLNVLERILPAPESLGIAGSPLAASESAPNAAGPSSGTVGSGSQPDYSAVPAGNPGLGTMADLLASFVPPNGRGAGVSGPSRNGR